MARKVVCPHCNAETYDTPSCGRCGGVLRQPNDSNLTPDQKEQKKLDAALVYKISMLERARDVHSKLESITLARFKAMQNIDDVTVRSTRIKVERDTKQYVYAALLDDPVKLGEGQYSLGNLVLAGKGQSETIGCVICEVSEAPITVTFVFPDYDSFRETLFQEKDRSLVLQGIDEALSSLSLRTSDDRLGGAMLQVRLRCNDPIKLIRCHEATAGEEDNRHISRDGNIPIFKQRPKSWWERAVAYFFPEQPEIVTKTLETKKQITMDQVYPMIRLELAEAIGNAVRDFTVEALYDKQDSNRARLHANIKSYMEKTLEGYGLQIVDVVAFQFRSPDYEEFLQRRGDNALRKKDLDNDRLAADNRKVMRDLDHQEFEHVEQVEEKKDHMKLERTERFQEREGQLKLEQQARELALDKQRNDFNRQEDDLDADRQHQKALRALELQAKLQEQQIKALQNMQNAEHQRRIEAIKLIASYPPEQQFLLAMQYNPELQKAFIAMQQAQSQQDKVAMAERFQVQIQAIYGQQSDQTNALLLEAAKQLGLVAAAKATGPKQPHVIVHEVAPPNTQRPDEAK